MVELILIVSSAAQLFRIYSCKLVEMNTKAGHLSSMIKKNCFLVFWFLVLKVIF